MHRRLRTASLALLVLAACASEPPPPTVMVPAQPPTVTVPPAPPPPPPPAPPEPAPAADGPESPLEPLLREAASGTACGSYDYHPHGGIQSLWCHKPPRLTVEGMAQLSRVDIFRSGPHARTNLVLNAPQDFGHYNPEFVKWLVDKAPPSGRDSAARKLTQPYYDKHLAPLAEVFWRTLRKAKDEPACFEREKKAYADLIAKKKLPASYYERWFYWMNPKYCARAAVGLGPNHGFDYFLKNGFDGGVDGNVTKTVIGFWLRRSMDGTMDSFAEGLTKLVAAYQPSLMSK